MIRKFDVAYFMISVDSLEDNKAFAEKEHADFPLLANPDKKVAVAYGVVSPARPGPISNWVRCCRTQFFSKRLWFRREVGEADRPAAPRRARELAKQRGVGGHQRRLLRLRECHIKTVVNGVIDLAGDCHGARR